MKNTIGAVYAFVFCTLAFAETAEGIFRFPFKEVPSYNNLNFGVGGDAHVGPLAGEIKDGELVVLEQPTSLD